jgi:diguanylate cyclase (GGDEF)-like protein/PAS domain S-box-containing protein
LAPVLLVRKMAPITAFNLTLFGLCLVMIGRRTVGAARATHVLAIIAGCDTLVAFTGHIFGAQSLYAVPLYNTVSLVSAMGGLLVSIGILAARPDGPLTTTLASTGLGGIVARRMLPWAVGLPLAFSWLRVKGERLRLYNGDFGDALAVSADVIIICTLIFVTARTIDVVGRRQRLLAGEIGELKRMEEELRESELRFRQLTENMKEVFFLVDPPITRIFYVSPAYAELWGRSCESLYAQPLSFGEAIHPDDKARAFAEIAPDGVVIPFDVEYRILRPNGTLRWIRSRSFPIRDEIGKIYRYAGVAEDITESKQAAEDVRRETQLLEESNRRFAMLGEMTEMLQIATDFDEAGGIVESFLGRIGLGVGGALYVYNESRNDLNAVARWGDVAVAGSVTPEECWALRSGQPYGAGAENRSPVCAHVTAAGQGGEYRCLPMSAQAGTLGLLHVVFGQDQPAVRDEGARLAVRVSEQLGLALANLRLRETLRAQSVRDALTGLFNRRYLEESLVRELNRADREKGPVTVLMLDVDHFKPFNDLHGHEAGDAALRLLGRLLQQSVRGSDFACRFGGEEFVVVLPATNVEGAREWCRRFLEALREKEINLHGTVLPPLTASIGIAIYPDHGEDAESILQAADLALYDAKHAGRDRYVAKGEVGHGEPA